MAKHGASDWSKYRPDSVTFPVEDLAELGTRLRGVISTDRRGAVAWFDDFEHGVNSWVVSLDAADAKAAISALRARFGGYSLEIKPGAGNAYGLSIYHREGMTPTGNWGFESSVRLHAHQGHFSMTLGTFYAGRNVTGGIKYNPATDSLYYYNLAGGWTLLDDNLTLDTDEVLFHVFKVVVDTAAEQYKRILVNQKLYDLSNIACSAQDTTIEPMVQIGFDFYATAVASTLFLDNIILTQDE